jgi:Zn-finger nucleic acid-binding protein
MFISREREYRADAAAVRMTRNPVALAETLYLLSRNWRGAGFIGSGFEMLCIVNPTATALDESEGFWADLVSTHPPIQKRISVLLNMAHMNIAALDATMNGKTKKSIAPSPALFHAMNPQQQWQGPFSLAELSALPWLSPLTWIRTENQQPVERAWKHDALNALFVSRLSQGEKSGTDLACPSCKQALIMESYEGTQVYQCRFCAGTLVDTEKIARILARTGQDLACSERVKALAKTALEENQRAFAQQKLLKQHRTTTPLLACPKCKQPMYRGFYSGAYLIEIDRCSFCNITWFNQDELEMLQCLVQNSH